MEPYDVAHFGTPKEFREWLEEHHESAQELWVGYWKKSTLRPSVTWEETVDAALCFGWIDGIRKRLDDEAYTIRFTPRRAKSVWSHRNIDRFTALSEAGLVTPAGSRAYSFAQQTPPALSSEYLARLRGHAAAWRGWEARPPGYRRQVSHWVMSAKREETRERRLAALIADSAVGRKVKPLR